MSQINSAGQRFREAISQEQPLQIVGTINALSALMAEEMGFSAIYLSGAGVANASFGLPDLGMTTLNDVCEDVRRITAVSTLPLLVDADTGWGNEFMIARSITQLQRAGAGACHIEDQVSAKRCGHRPNKQLVSSEQMCDRLKAAVDARYDESFVIMARTDACASEGIDAAIERAQAYIEVGADMIFAEAVTELSDYQLFTSYLSVPVLANITEFGQTPLYRTDELSSVGVAMVLYPLSAFRAMNQAAMKVYADIRQKGSQSDQMPSMQTRKELYQLLGYESYEKKLDQLQSQSQQSKLSSDND